MFCSLDSGSSRSFRSLDLSCGGCRLLTESAAAPYNFSLPLCVGRAPAKRPPNEVKHKKRSSKKGSDTPKSVFIIKFVQQGVRLQTSHLTHHTVSKRNVFKDCALTAGMLTAKHDCHLGEPL